MKQLVKGVKKNNKVRKKAKKKGKEVMVGLN